jgi:hypothetical protein
VLSQLNIQLKTPTPPGSRSTNSPHNAKQLEKQASTVKKLLRVRSQRSQSPSALLETRFDNIIKGHELNLNELVLAREEIREYRALNEKQDRKGKRSARQQAITEGSAIQEGLEQFQRKNEASEAQDAHPIDPALSAVRPRVPAPPPPNSVLIVIIGDILELDVLIHLVISFYIEMQLFG